MSAPEPSTPKTDKLFEPNVSSKPKDPDGIHVYEGNPFNLTDSIKVFSSSESKDLALPQPKSYSESAVSNGFCWDPQTTRRYTQANSSMNALPESPVEKWRTTHRLALQWKKMKSPYPPPPPRQMPVLSIEELKSIFLATHNTSIKYLPSTSGDKTESHEIPRHENPWLECPLEIRDLPVSEKIVIAVNCGAGMPPFIGNMPPTENNGSGSIKNLQKLFSDTFGFERANLCFFSSLEYAIRQKFPNYWGEILRTMFGNERVRDCFEQWFLSIGVFSGSPPNDTWNAFSFDPTETEIVRHSMPILTTIMSVLANYECGFRIFLTAKFSDNESAKLAENVTAAQIQEIHHSEKLTFANTVPFGEGLRPMVFIWNPNAPKFIDIMHSYEKCHFYALLGAKDI